MQIYISYSWKQPAMSIVRNWLCPNLDQTHIDYRIDKEDCGYGQDIEKFEKEIGDADKVIVVVSRTYLYSIDCMYELALIIDHGNLQNRLIPVCLDDFERSNQEYDKIYTYWERQAEQIRQNLRGNENRDRPFLKEMKKVQHILKYIGKAWEKICDINTLPFEDLSKNNFRILIAHIKNEVLIDDDTMDQIEAGVPVERTMQKPDIKITQYGSRSITQVINSGSSIINM